MYGEIYLVAVLICSERATSAVSVPDMLRAFSTMGCQENGGDDAETRAKA
jgi:hypothetical protein